MQYELFYLVGEKQESRLDEIKGGVEAILTQEGATLVDQEVIDKRKMSYEIKHQRKGTYITRRFELPEIDFWADASNAEKEFGISAITKKMTLNNDVLRFIIVKTEDLPDLGAKDRRKAQELSQEKTSSKKPEIKKPERKFEKKETPKKEVFAKAETKESSVAGKEEMTPKKKDSADIDKQLDELLNI